MKKFILLSLFFVSSYAYAMENNVKPSSLLGFLDDAQTFNSDIRKKIDNLLLYKTSTDLFPHVKVTLDTGEDRQQIQYEEGKLMGIEETAGSECLIILQNGKNRMLFPSSVTDIEKTLTKGEKILKALQTIDPTITTQIRNLLNQTSTSLAPTRAQISYLDNGVEKIITGHINEPTEKETKLGRYSILPVLIQKKRTFDRKSIPLAHIIAIEAVKHNAGRSKSTSPKTRSKKTSRKRAASSSK